MMWLDGTEFSDAVSRLPMTDLFDSIPGIEYEFRGFIEFEVLNGGWGWPLFQALADSSGTMQYLCLDPRQAASVDDRQVKNSFRLEYSEGKKAYAAGLTMEAEGFGPLVHMANRLCIHASSLDWFVVANREFEVGALFCLRGGSRLDESGGIKIWNPQEVHRWKTEEFGRDLIVTQMYDRLLQHYQNL
jgi:hypothetical protein